MNTASDDADSLLASLKSSEHYQGLYLRFASFFRPFEDFVSFNDYKPNAVKKSSIKKKSSKDLLSKEKIRPIAKQFHYFLCKALKLLPDLLRRSPSNGAVDEERLSQEGAAELLGIYRLTIRCLFCIAPCLSGQPYMVHIQWGQLVRRLETWDKYSVAEEEGVSLIESLCDVLVTSPPFKQPELFLPDPSKLDSAGKDPQLACLVFEVVIVLTYCVCKSQSKDTSAYERILTLAEQVQPWIRIIEVKAMAARHNIFVDALYRCALFLAKEVMSFDDILVQRFCVRMLKECIQSSSVDCFPLMAHRVCSSIDVKWEKKTSLVVDLLIMSMEVSYSGDKVNLAKYVDGLFDFASSCAEGLYLTWKETCKRGSGLIPKIALHQVSIALELCCKAVWVHINLLHHMQLENSDFLQDVDEFADPIEGLVNDAYAKSARIIDIMYRCGVASTRNVLVESLYEFSIVEFSSLKSSLSFPLVKQWVKMLCKDFKDANEVDEVPVLFSLMLSHCPTWSTKILGEILEQELVAYNQLDLWNSDLFRKMEIKVIDKLLMDVFTARDFSLQRSRILVRKAVALRTRGVESLNNCFECLREAIALLDNGTCVPSDDNTLVYHQLGFAHLLCAHLGQEAQRDWESIQFDVHRAICLLTKIEFAAHHTLDICLRPSLRSTIYMLCDVLDLLSLKGFLKFHFDLYNLISKFCNLESLSIVKCLAMLCAGRKLGHSLCTSPIDEELASRISEHFNNKAYSISSWTDCLKDTPYNLLMFLQKMFLSDSILKEQDISIIENLYSCKLTVDEIKVVAASLLLEIPAKSEMSFIAGQIYHDLAERLFTSGRFLRKKFVLINKKPAKLTESPADPKSEFDHLHFEMLGLTAAEVWRDNHRIESCFLGPWSILNCYLESVLQVGLLHEATGDSVMAEKLFLTGKRFSILQCLPIFGIAFTSALGKLYSNKLLWNAAENELNIARKLLQENEMISCKHCKLNFEVEIDIQLGDLSLGCSNKEGKSLQSLGRNIEESYAQITVNNKSRYESKHFPEDSNIMVELKPRRSSRNRSLHVVGHVSTVVQNKGSCASPSGVHNAIKRGRRKRLIKENKSVSVELGCSEDLLFCRIKFELLASLILISSIDGSIPLPLCLQKSLSLSHWAAFFHQASVGAVVHSQYHSFMTDKDSSFKTCEVSERKSFLKSAVVANGISRYIPAKLENLGERVEDFYKDLPRISIVCISLLGCDYVNLLGEMLILPSFFPAWLLITRLDGTNQPISMFVPADSVLEDIQLNSPCKEPVCESLVPVSAWTCPWKSAVIDDVVPSYRLILEKNFCSLSNQSPGDQSEARLNYMKWWSCRKILDNQLRSLLKKIEDAWIGPWGCLLLGESLNNECLDTDLARLSSYLKSECNFEVNDTLLRIILSGSQSVFAAEVCIAQLLMYRGHFGRGGCCGEQRFRAFSLDNCEGVKRMLTCIKNLLPKEIDQRLLIDRQPMILVLDSNVQMLSWESMPVLQNQEVYRMPSVGSILLKLNLKTSPKKGVGFEIDFPSIDPSHAYYLLNPSGDLNYTQQEFEEWFRNQKWQGKVGDVPTNEELLLALQNHDLFLYFGHGSGMQYMRANSFEKLDRCAAAFLMGCSSGCLRQSGSYAPQGAPLHYLFAGSPSVIANLWEVSDKDIDRFAKAILSSWIQDSSKLNNCSKCCELNSGSSSVVNNSTRKGTCEEKQGVDRLNCRECEANPRVASFIGHARGACKLPSIIGASVVCYGVPTVLRRKQ
ncbi:hypothetical protein HPP92_008899 [Vanilla planifolia]|uniref:separase n=1 Tax=Vanilla planifolia TaxID=51239 RepID=A0A835V470_VANPL|nr:hypothetical protein HPP92_008899 [Vanilla planifolia]